MSTAAPTGGRPRLLGEILVVAVLVLVYDRIRDFSGTRSVLAVANGRHVLVVERLLHVDVEHRANQILAIHPLLADWASWYYQVAHLTVTLLVLLWVYLRHPSAYRPARNALLGINLVGLLVFWVLPVAPPRLLPGAGFVDLAVTSGVADRTTTVSPDLYAAMPSLHVAWAVWVALQVLVLSRSRLFRSLAFGHAALTCLIVLATANHYVLDVLSGAAVTVLLVLLVLLVPLARQSAEPRSRRRPSWKNACASTGVCTSAMVRDAPNDAFQKPSATGGPLHGPT